MFREGIIRTWGHRVPFIHVMLALLCFSACGKSRSLDEGIRADKIVIVKSTRTLNLMSGDRVIRTYRVALGRNPAGPKARQGDHKTPEGLYVVDAKENPSRFHLALHISYPNQLDRERAHEDNVNPGGDVEIHGIENGLGWIGRLHRHVDWTDGCIAVTDSEIDEIWKVTAVGTKVEIRP
jgi:murein L,D-transpeptidase YafK